MDVKATYEFGAPPERVWAIMLDPEYLAQCMPGCENLTPVGDGQYTAALSAGVGAIKGRFQAKIALTDLVPPQSFRMSVQGQGTPGFVNGSALISLKAKDGGTLVHVEGEAQVGGTIARVGSRLIGSVNKMMMERFFSCLQKASDNGAQ